jgi:hypothetical protein
MLLVPPSFVDDEIKLLSRRKFHHHNHHDLPSHARTPICTPVVRHPQPPTPSLQTPRTVVTEVETAQVAPIYHPTSKFQSRGIRTPLANPFQFKDHTGALRHQTRVHQAPCHIQYGWPVHRSISAPARSGSLLKDKRVACTIRLKRKNERDSGRAGDIIRTIRIPRVPIREGTEKERGRDTERRSRNLHHRKLAAGKKT